MQVKIQKLFHDVKDPIYATDGSACFDIYSHGVVKYDGVAEIHRTGLKLEFSNYFVLLLFSRSGDGFERNTRLANCVGVIDSDYRGEVKAKVHNDSNTTYQVKAGERIAQAMIVPISLVKFMVVDELSSTERGEGGGGSTGKMVEDRILANLGGDFEHIKPQGDKVYAK